MTSVLDKFYKLLMWLSCVSMLLAFAAIMLGVVARELRWDIQGLDAYAGYAIAATLFLALPGTLKHGDHIRVTLVMQRLSPRAQNVLEYVCLMAASALSVYLAWFACRLVWVSFETHDVSPSADASPLWIPQLAMALGCIGFALSFLHALWARWTGGTFFDVHAEGELAKTE
ncbi:MAG: TRAP transporter small permease [Burkholderiaceae bacterium]|nr:TRAP transporter small permease [Burkholderiaceae bacterium]